MRKNNVPDLLQPRVLLALMALLVDLGTAAQAFGAEECTKFGPDKILSYDNGNAHAVGSLLSGQPDILDIDPFVTALTDPANYVERYPECNIMSADCDRDLWLNFNDINPFLQLLMGGLPARKKAVPMSMPRQGTLGFLNPGALMPRGSFIRRI